MKAPSNDNKTGHGEDSEFTPKGSVDVSSAARDMARKFSSASHRVDGRKQWVASFSWVLETIVRKPDGSPPEHYGPRVSLGAFERGELPPGVTINFSGVEIAVIIPEDVLAASKLRLIDVDENAFGGFVLR